MAPASIMSINVSNKSFSDPDGCCQLNIKIDDTVSSTPRHRGDPSPRTVEAIVIIPSVDANNKDDNTFRL